MKKLSFLTLMAAILTTSAANAIEINPYVSDKLSYSILNQTDSAVIGQTPQYSQQFHDKTSGTFGNKLAVGIAFPIDAISGAIRTELEWGINAKTKIKNESYKDTYGLGYSSGFSQPPAVTDYEIKTSAYFFNAYYDFDTGTAWTPYVGIGAGWAKIDLESDYSVFWGSTSTQAGHWCPGLCDSVISKGDTNNFAWNVGLGVAFAINDNFAIDFGYRYARLGDIKADTMAYTDGVPNDAWIGVPIVNYDKATVSLHDINLGLRYSF
ncbi:MAG: outer membrane beta-barrel protein [Rickettsiales bacterium]|nr:outer membrane beta-barrel protein [Rickettsiales bacterium]